MQRAYFSSSISGFIDSNPDSVLGKLTRASAFPVEQYQRNAWVSQINHLQVALRDITGSIFFEFSIPRMGKRADVVLVAKGAVFVVEYKVGETNFLPSHVDQVVDYALDLKNFHSTSQNQFVVPVLVATKAAACPVIPSLTNHGDKFFEALKTNKETFSDALEAIHTVVRNTPPIESNSWLKGTYSPTPTIIEAAKALYSGHQVSEISRHDADARSLKKTTNRVSSLISEAQANNYKVICFLTGVPGAGKTLIGLDIATEYASESQDTCRVFLSELFANLVF